MPTIKEEMERMLRQMDETETRNLLPAVQRLGRKKRDRPKYKSLGVTVPPEWEAVLIHLIDAQRPSLSAVIRDLIKLGLPALTGRHMHELLEEQHYG